VPSFEAFGRFLEAANPFAFWVQAGQLAWLPWLEAVRAAMLPFSSASALPKASPDAVLQQQALRSRWRQQHKRRI
jgi:hypothetical protein